MSYREYRDWQLYYGVEPWGVIRDNLHAGIVASAVLAPHVKKGKKPPSASDFLLKDPATRQRERQAQTPRVLAALKAMAVRTTDGKPRPSQARRKT